MHLRYYFKGTILKHLWYNLSEFSYYVSGPYFILDPCVVLMPTVLVLSITVPTFPLNNIGEHKDEDDFKNVALLY